MFYSEHLYPITLKILLGTFVIILLGILIFGLIPKNFTISNNVKWVSNPPGIRFGKYGIAYTEPFIEAVEDINSEQNGFSIEIALKPERHQEKRFQFIFAVHNGEDSTQLLMGQWGTDFIVMNGDDYDNTKRKKRISVDTLSMHAEELFVTITTSEIGTKIYLNGQLISSKRDLKLKLSAGGARARIIIGNSPYGKNSWIGTLYGLAFYRDALTSEKAARHYATWIKKRSFSFAKRENPFVLFLFDETNGFRSFDHANGKNHLHIPSKTKILQTKFLDISSSKFELKIGFLKDIAFNLLGFMPFGFILSAVLLKFNGPFVKHHIIIAVASGFLLSLMLEFIQCWIPSRSSSAIDLVFNTLGAFIGAKIYTLKKIFIFE